MVMFSHPPLTDPWVLRVWDPKKQRKVAVGDVANRTLLCYPKPQLLVPTAWALQDEVLELLEQEGIETIIFVEDDGETTWQVPTAFFRQHSFVLDRGHGRQYALPLSSFPSSVSCQPVHSE